MDVQSDCVDEDFLKPEVKKEILGTDFEDAEAEIETKYLPPPLDSEFYSENHEELAKSEVK